MNKMNQGRGVLLIVLALGFAGPLFAWTLQQAPVMTQWAYQVNPAEPLPEYPRPQMVRPEWMNLNGIWQFQPGTAGDTVPVGQVLSQDILVPFPVESAISGIMQHYDRLWYRRLFEIPSRWNGQRILLHFGAVDWETEVYINGSSVGIHKGGYDAFSFDITPFLLPAGQQELIVRVYDPTDNGGYPRGKQTLSPGGIMYTPTTGIWQTVWLEPVPQISLTELKLIPDVDHKLLNITGWVSQPAANLTIQATAYDNGVPAGTVSGAVGDQLQLVMHNPKLWSPETPFLYDLKVVLKQGSTVIDQVDSYFGMRKIALGTVDGVVKMLLNDTFVFQMGPLDQGFWPDGIYTAPTDAALRWDLEQTKALGFNMTRKHIKVEPARWYYWADKLGLLVWQDMPSVNSYTSNPQPIDKAQFKTELTQMVRQHWNSPAVIMWVIFNESQGQHDTAPLCAMVKAMDPSRLVNQASGGSHYGAGDVLDIHNYPPPSYPVSSTQARVCGEYGGIGMRISGHMWNPNSWGYTMVNSAEELASVYDSYSQQLISFKQNQGLSAAVYTQITDVEIEINGLITYDRAVVKADAGQIRLSNLMYARTYQDVLPTSQQTPQLWRYTTSTPPSNWSAPSFHDASWTEGPGGFGTAGTPGAVIGTVWNTSDIWLRRMFNPGPLTPADLDRLVWRIHHDEDAEVYINGALALATTGYTTSYIPLPAAAEAKAALVPNADNVIAVHCRQTIGGQFIDVGLALETIHASSGACGQWGYAPADLNYDCAVDIEDLALFIADWWTCSLPGRLECINYLLP
ncbi:MAG TPA: glycoside hydrolase family 2 TIM barrel-domain containing protein [Anaerohalosphaeraceae bacterium]|nr:glycoside hydrolase family 2 TIM barrel-domain containing protein [Anaerohalosphaeraceae bacterium]HOM76652.1 glycoside hydrolase family 2 TIM barrel-domain containing protein [Anaerohalosphaeraceae bacterium]HPC65167.1 glycoside hydrolase family 2 TIM barrel-domain containing protein [Anaerohalosphaeraceae bacterium]HPO69891.1 glycoside hydrolase family 2 TIM barrel-domain containing protein [Anaerohalosphaeraceae bacterium]HRS71916.1 glycoside hydrolase family 2 TIM barrel-domain containin